MRLVFAGTPDFAVPSLEALARWGEVNGADLSAVYTQPDRPAGRGRADRASPVKQNALNHGWRIVQPVTFRDQDAVAELASLAPDLMVVAAYGLLLPPSVLAIPRLGCVNVHASLLPRWRGAAPIQRAIAAGDAVTGITIMQMDKGLDTGPMLLKKETPIGPTDTAAVLHDRLAALGAEALVEALPGIVDGSLAAEPQDEALATHARKLSKAEARIDWGQPAREIERCVRAFNSWPVADTLLGETQLRVWAADVLPDRGNASPGRVLAATADGIDVATGDGVLRLTRVQLAGGRAMDAAAFVNAHHLAGLALG